MRMPADGVSSATKAPGRHAVTIPPPACRTSPAGHYVIVVEAARELGGRETVRVPFRWGGANTARATGPPNWAPSASPSPANRKPRHEPSEDTPP
jgi:hypothetical protein